MAKVFISHSSKDKVAALRLAEDLKRLGHTVWFDAWEIKVGDCIVTKVEHGITDCDAVILLLSKHAVASHWVDREWKAKYWDEIEANEVKVLPVLLEDCDRPTLLKTKKYADIRGDAYATGLVELMQAFPQIVMKVVQASAAPALPSADARVTTLLSKIHARTAPLAECVSDALALAIALGDNGLRSFCELELRGYWDHARVHQGETTEPPEGAPTYRAIDAYASVNAEVNPMYYGWGDSMANVLTYLDKDENFTRMKIIMPDPLAQLEERAKQGSHKNLLVMSFPMSRVMPDATEPEGTVRTYARGDAVAQVVERIRSELSTRILKHLPALTASS